MGIKQYEYVHSFFYVRIIFVFRGPVCGFLVFLHQIATEPFVSLYVFHCDVSNISEWGSYADQIYVCNFEQNHQN